MNDASKIADERTDRGRDSVAAQSESYYGRPILKPHVWTPYIPLYFWVGGTAGAAAVQAAVARARGHDRMADVQIRAALAGAVISPVLLIVDLGVPARFLHMLRVVKPTSPMNLGTYILLSFSGAVGLANVAPLVGMRGIARGAEIVAALIGPMLATYTAVLIADTATPVWHEAHDVLPLLFVTSGIAGSGAVGAAFGPAGESGIAKRMMILGALGLAGVERVMEARLGPLLSEPYRQGRAGVLKRVATALGVTGAILGVVAGTSRTRMRLAAAAVAAAGIVERFTIMEAGRQSALDPRYVVEPQRARLDARAGKPSSMNGSAAHNGVAVTTQPIEERASTSPA